MSNVPLILVPTRAGASVARRHGLRCEAPTDWTHESVAPCRDLLFTGHAPFSREGRLNIGALDEEYRRVSREIIAGYIRAAVVFPSVRTVVLHPAPRTWNETAGSRHPLKQVSDYELFIQGLRELARTAEQVGVGLVLENNRAYWEEIPNDEPYDPGKHDGTVPEYFATSAEEWAGVPADVGAPNLQLCLDTSHAVTYAHRFPEQERLTVLQSYLDLGAELIRHVHWNGNTLTCRAGRADRHLPLGAGDLPPAFHHRVGALTAARSFTLERWVDEDTLAAELEFINTL